MSSVAREVADYLEENSIGVVGTNIFIGTRPSLAPDDVVIVYDTTGGKDDPELNIREPHIQIFVRNADYELGYTKIKDIHQLLIGKANLLLTATSDYVYYIEPIQSPGHLRNDDDNRSEFSVNFRLRVRNQS